MIYSPDDDYAINPSEVVDEFRKPLTYKESVDVNKLQMSMKKAMEEIGFNLKYVQENPWSAKIAEMQFKQLVRQLDHTHADFLKNMALDPSVDQETLR